MNSTIKNPSTSLPPMFDETRPTFYEALDAYTILRTVMDNVRDGYMGEVEEPEKAQLLEQIDLAIKVQWGIPDAKLRGPWVN